MNNIAIIKIPAIITKTLQIPKEMREAREEKIIIGSIVITARITITAQTIGDRKEPENERYQRLEFLSRFPSFNIGCHPNR